MPVARHDDDDDIYQNVSNVFWGGVFLLLFYIYFKYTP